MSRDETRSTASPLSEGEEMVAKMRRGVLAALEEHKRLGRSIVTYDLATDQIREIPPGEILVEADHPASDATNLIP